MGTAQSITRAPFEGEGWDMTVKVYKTVTYVLKKGDTTIVKRTGVTGGNVISYNVNIKTGEMHLVKPDGELVPAGHDGDLATLVSTLKEMVAEVNGHIE